MSALNHSFKIVQKRKKTIAYCMISKNHFLANRNRHAIDGAAKWAEQNMASRCVCHYLRHKVTALKNHLPYACHKKRDIFLDICIDEGRHWVSFCFSTPTTLFLGKIFPAPQRVLGFLSAVKQLIGHHPQHIIIKLDFQTLYVQILRSLGNDADHQDCFYPRPFQRLPER